MADPVRIGIIGAGKMATWHLRAYARLEGAKIVAIANPTTARGEQLARRFSIPRHEADFRRLLDTEELDAVDICTPTGLHREMIVEALTRGLHVYCEKPLCRTVEEVDEIIGLNRLKRRVIFNGFNLRHCREFMRMRDVIQSGILGEIRFISMLRTTKANPDSYVFKKDQSAGIFVEFAGHFIDLLDWWGFRHPERVSAHGASVFAESNGPDTVSVNLAYSSGLSVTIANSLAIPGVAPEISVVGRSKVMHLRYGKIIIEKQPTSSSIPGLLVNALRRGCVLPFRILYNPFVGSCRHFIACIRQGEQSPQDEHAARESIALATKAMHSFREERSMRLGSS